MIYFLVGLAAALATAVFTVKKEALTLSGAIAAGVLIVTSALCGKWFGLVYLLVVYFTIAAMDKILKKKTDGIFSDINKKSGARDHVQVFANGFAAFLCLLLYKLTDRQAFMIAYGVSLAQAFADSIASDVGVLSKGNPVSICRFRTVPKGLSGGVSLLGIAASLCAGLFCGLLYYLFFFQITDALLIVSFSFAGCLIDSVLGDLAQEKFRCPVCGIITEKTTHCGQDTNHLSGIRHLDNCMVNLISNVLSTLLAVLCLLW